MPKLAMKENTPNDLEALSESGDVQEGSPLPGGARSRGEGVNFSFFSRHATRVRLEFL